MRVYGFVLLVIVFIVLVLSTFIIFMGLKELLVSYARNTIKKNLTVLLHHSSHAIAYAMMFPLSISRCTLQNINTPSVIHKLVSCVVSSCQLTCCVPEVECNLVPSDLLVTPYRNLKSTHLQLHTELQPYLLRAVSIIFLNK